MLGPTEECRACAQILVHISAVLFARRVTLAQVPRQHLIWKAGVELMPLLG